MPGSRRELVTYAYRKALVAAKVVARFALLFVGIAIFAQLADEVHEQEVIPFDEPILAWLRAQRTPALTEFMLFVTELGASRVLIVLAVTVGLLLWWHRDRHAATFVWVTGAGAGLMNHALKLWFERARPDELFQLSAASGYAFPSGHSMGSAAVYGALAIVAYTRFPPVKWPVIALCAIMVFGVGLSRMYLAVHYPSDVLAGWALGFTWPLWLKGPLLTRPWNGFWRGRTARPEPPAKPAAAVE